MIVETYLVLDAAIRENPVNVGVMATSSAMAPISFTELISWLMLRMHDIEYVRTYITELLKPFGPSHSSELREPSR